MGFLYQVLKDFSDKQPYEAGKEYLNTLINDHLEPNLNLGHDGFRSVIKEVVKGVSKYNASLQASHTRVKNPINALLSSIKSESEWRIDMEKINVENVSDTAVKKAEVAVRNRLDECKRFADKFNAKFNFSANKNNIKEAIENLNCDLSTKTKNCLCIVKHESERLEKLAEKEKEDLEATKKYITDTLQELEKQVKMDINREVKNLVAQLKKLVQKISVHLKSIKRELTDYVSKLNAWIANADKEVQAAKSEAEKVERKEPGKYDKKAIDDVADNMNTWATDPLENYIHKQVKPRLTELVEEATAKLAALDKVYKGKLLAIAEAVNKIKPAIQKLGALFPKDDSTKPESIKSVFAEVRDKLRAISGAGTRDNHGLQGIASAVKDYASGFGSDSLFGSTVMNWVNDILEKDPVKTHIKYYVDNNTKNKYMLNSAEESKSSVIQAIRNAIITALNDDASAAAAQVTIKIQKAASSKESIKMYCEAVKQVCNAFAQNVEQKITQGVIQVSAIEKQLQLSSVLRVDTPTERYYLHEAIQATLNQLHAKAGQVAKELETLALLETRVNHKKSSIAAELDKIVGVSADFFATVRRSIGRPLDPGPDDPKTDFALAVDNAINLAEKQVENIKQGSSVDEVSLGDNPVKAKRDAAYEPLDQAIKNIGEEATALSVEATKDKLTKWSAAIKTNLEKLVDAFVFHGTLIKGMLDKHIDAIGKKRGGKADEDTLQKIHEQLNVLLTKDLTDAIALTENFPGEAAEFQKKCVDELHKRVGEETKESIDKLTTHAQKQYVSSIKLLLQEFGNKACKELAELPKEIDDDLTIGFKGFMLRIAGKESHTSGQDTKLGDMKKVVEDASYKSMKERFTKLAEAFHAYFNQIHAYSKQQVTTTPQPPTQELTKLDTLNTDFNDLFNHLTTTTRTYIFDHNFSTKLNTLKSSLDHLRPSNIANIQNPALVDTLKSGINALVGELSKTYLNAYDGASDGMILVDARTTKVTDDGKKCAKVCLSLLSILYSEFKALTKYCVARCKSDQININTDLGKYFVTQGYKVTEDGKKHWELQNSRGMTGLFICKRLFGADGKRIYNADKTQHSALDKLHDCLQTYYQVNHVATFSARKRPCNIFEMLCWMSGLPCNIVYQDMLDDAISELFVDPSKQPEDADGIPVTYISDEPLAAYPQNIALDNTQRAVKRLCSRSHDILTTIAGTGDAYSMYAVDYSTNWLNFHYPSKGEECLQMLLDILRRLLPSLKFLHTQCGLSAAYHGWSGCQYGRGVKHSNWQCREHPAEESTDCQPRSPLMSYLRDCLPGCLPHQLVSAGCKSDCKTCPKSLPSAPCITPLGFRGFSGSTKTGKKLGEALTKFFDNSNINTLFGLMPKPPSTLPEHFQFVLSLSNMLKNEDSSKAAVSTAFNTSINEVSIDLYRDSSKLTSALRNAYLNDHSHEGNGHHKANEADLYTLSKTTSCIQPNEMNIHCGPYLSSTCSDTYKYLAEKHSGLYLSWAVYLPWTFYNYLKSLLDAFQQIDCVNFGCTRCKCKPGSHGKEYNCKCNALVTCRGVISTFYKYGFTFGSASQLMQTDSRRYCRNFYNQICNVLKSQHFTKLFEECDNFIWIIRQPFTYLVLALWSLSLLYLICVMVGRLDVLHIRSHLRISSSHKITAQSLLAAAQVGRLAKISYLQP